LAVIFKVENYIPMSMEETRGSRYIKLILLMSPIFFLLYYSVKEKKLEDLKENLGYDHYDKEVNHRTLLFVYLFLSFTILIALAVIRK
jgi:hypothetical protein